MANSSFKFDFREVRSFGSFNEVNIRVKTSLVINSLDLLNSGVMLILGLVEVWITIEKCIENENLHPRILLRALKNCKMGHHPITIKASVSLQQSRNRFIKRLLGSSVSFVASLSFSPTARWNREVDHMKTPLESIIALDSFPGFGNGIVGKRRELDGWLLWISLHDNLSIIFTENILLL
ncbi:hypothetical protein Tco_1217173 [Tanacetum coccineum]